MRNPLCVCHLRKKHWWRARLSNSKVSNCWRPSIWWKKSAKVLRKPSSEPFGVWETPAIQSSKESKHKMYSSRIFRDHFVKCGRLEYIQTVFRWISILEAFFCIKLLYHRERICFSSTLSCIGEAEKITKPLTLSAGAHFNQPGNFWARQPFSINQAILDNTWPGTCFFYLPQQLTPPPLSMASSNAASWPRCGHLVISQKVRRKSRS